jgi:hypothetical protein
MITLRRNRTNLTDRGIELLTQDEQDLIENGQRGGIPVHAYRNEITCPNCKRGRLRILGTVYACTACEAKHELVGNRPGERIE